MKKLTFKRTMITAIALTTLLNAMPIVASASYTDGVTRAAAAATASVSVPASDATLTFSNSGVTASGAESGYEIEGTALKITESGVYTITGTCADGSVTVKKGVTGVTLILKDLSLASTTTAPLSCNKETGVTLYAVGAVTLTDKESLANEDSDDFEGAAIKVKSGASLTITGTGTLTADGSACKNGIKGAAESTITVEGAVTLNIKAANNGLADDNAVVINGGAVNVTADGDGIKAEPDEDDTVSKGTVTINGGSVTIKAQGDGIQATGDVTITGGSFDIQTHGGASNAKQLGSDDSAKGIKSDSKVIISGGTFALNSADDALHANGNVTVTGGSYAIQAGDDAFHADYDLVIGEKGGSGPEITVNGSYEGLEGARIYLNSGKGSIVSSDDGVNAATDVSANEIALYVNGGEWTVDANGDGLDAGGDSGNNSGGSIYINGGVTKVFGSPNGGNAALDYDSTCQYNGGTLLTVDVTGMNQQPQSGTYVLFGTAASMGGGMMGGQPGNMGGMGQQSGMMGQRGNMGGQQSNQRTAVFTANVSKQDSMARMGGQPGNMGNMGGQQSGMSGAPAMGGQQSGAMGGQQTVSASTGSVSISKGSTIEVKDSDGNTVISATGTKTANVVMLCDDSLVSGETYTLYVNGSAVATATATSGAQSGGMGQQQPTQMSQREQPGQSGESNPEQAQPAESKTAQSQPSEFNPEQAQPAEFNPEQNQPANNAPMGQQAPDMNNGAMGQQSQGFNPEQGQPANNGAMSQQNGAMGQVPGIGGAIGQQSQGFNPEQGQPANNGPMGQQNAPMGRQGMNNGAMGQQGMNNGAMSQQNGAMGQVPGMGGAMGQQSQGFNPEQGQPANNGAMGQAPGMGGAMGQRGMNNGPMGQAPGMDGEAFPFFVGMYR